MTAVIRFVACGAVFCLTTAAQAIAEPIRVTGGFMNVTSGSTPAPVEVAGTRGFSFNGDADPVEGRVDAFNSCPCLPGDIIPLDAAMFGAFTGTATLDGNTYDVTISTDPTTSMNWVISGPDVTAPPEASTAQSLQAQFTLTGSFIPDATPPSGSPTPIPLIGRGIATLTLRPDLADQPFEWDTTSVNYKFSDASVTPEPASLILIGIGTAVCGLRRLW